MFGIWKVLKKQVCEKMENWRGVSFPLVDLPPVARERVGVRTLFLYKEEKCNRRETDVERWKGCQDERDGMTWDKELLSGGRWRRRGRWADTLHRKRRQVRVGLNSKTSKLAVGKLNGRTAD